jgi:hypothetical protein
MFFCNCILLTSSFIGIREESAPSKSTYVSSASVTNINRNGVKKTFILINKKEEGKGDSRWDRSGVFDWWAFQVEKPELYSNLFELLFIFIRSIVEDKSVDSRTIVRPVGTKLQVLYGYGTN